jgi:hypothetical protein
MEGRTLYVPIDTQSYDLPDGSNVEQQARSGFSVEITGETPPHNEVCSGTRIYSPDGKAWHEAGYCFSVDPDGDVIWLWFKGTEEGSEHHFISGTGKYDGITGGGTAKQGTEWDDGKFYVDWTSSWEGQ